MILICYKNTKVNDPGSSHAGMGVTSNNNASFLQIKKHVNAVAISVNDGYHLRDYLNHKDYANVTHVVISAPFFDTGFLKSLCKQFPHINFTVTFHSNAGFLGLDKWAMKMLGELIQAENQIPNFRVSVNSQKFANVVNKIFKTNILTLPNLYYINNYFSKKFVGIDGIMENNLIKIGCFSAIRSLKNIPTAAFAAAILRNKLKVSAEFHIVVGRDEDPQAEKIVTGIENIFKFIPKIKLVKNEWTDNESFKRNIVGGMDILLMPSFTESFNNVTADGFTTGVPVVVSDAITWIPKKYRANADDAADIARVAEKILYDNSAVIDGLTALEKHNESSFRNWQSWIGIQRKDNLCKKIFRFFKKLMS